MGSCGVWIKCEKCVRKVWEIFDGLVVNVSIQMGQRYNMYTLIAIGSYIYLCFWYCIIKLTGKFPKSSNLFPCTWYEMIVLKYIIIGGRSALWFSNQFRRKTTLTNIVNDLFNDDKNMKKPMILKCLICVALSVVFALQFWNYGTVYGVVHYPAHL